MWHVVRKHYFDVLVQERRNYSAFAMELRISCTNPSIWAANLISLPYDQVPETDLKVGHLEMKFTGARSSNQLPPLDINIVTE